MWANPVATGVTTLNSLSNAITIASSQLTVGTSGQNININVPTTIAVNTINPVSPVLAVSIPMLNITSPNASITFSSSGSAITAITNVLVGQWYKSANQTGNSGDNFITYDTSTSWSDTALITHTGSSTDFTVVKAGIYQLEFSTTNSAGTAVWLATTTKGTSINLNRGGDQILLTNTITIPSATGYGQTVTGTVELMVGDIIRCRINQTLTSGTTLILGVSNVYDYNTTFTWTFIK